MKKKELLIEIIKHRIIELMKQRNLCDRCDDTYGKRKFNFDINLYCETYFNLINIEDEEEQRIKYNEFVDIAEQLNEYE